MCYEGPFSWYLSLERWFLFDQWIVTIIVILLLLLWFIMYSLPHHSSLFNTNSHLTLSTFLFKCSLFFSYPSPFSLISNLSLIQSWVILVLHRQVFIIRKNISNPKFFIPIRWVRYLQCRWNQPNTVFLFHFLSNNPFIISVTRIQ